MKFWKLFLYLLFLIYPSVSGTVLRHFVCKQIDDHSYLLTDLRIQCYTDQWTTYAFIAIALILIYPIGIPVFFFALLKLNQKDLRGQPTAQGHLTDQRRAIVAGCSPFPHPPSPVRVLLRVQSLASRPSWASCTPATVWRSGGGSWSTASTSWS